MTRFVYYCVIAGAMLSFGVPAEAALVTFTIDSGQSYSQIHVQTRNDGVTYDSTPQRPGSDTVAVAGTITADVAFGTSGEVTAVQFLDSDLGFIPAPGLSQPGNQVADFGLVNGPYNLALHDLSGHLQSGHYETDGSSYTFIPETLAVLPDGSIASPSNLFLNDVSALVDIGSGSTTLVANDPLTGPDQNVPTSPVTLINDNGILRLDFPSDFEDPLADLLNGGGDYTLAGFVGRIVATATVPEPSGLLLATVAALGIFLTGRRRKK